jgi:hypothetical protein
MLGKVCQQRGEALIELRQLAVHDLEVLLVRVPAFVVDGDERHAFFDETPCHEAGLTKRIATIALTHLLLLLAEIEELASVTQNEFIGLLFGIDDGFQRRIARQRTPPRVLRLPRSLRRSF